jgi:AbrB family looped-hinge helix DNA binding protein
VETVQLDENFEIAIPASIYKRVGAKIGDLISISVENGRVILEPYEAADCPKNTDADTKAGQRNSDWFGSVQGVYVGVEEIDEYIRAERADWE